MMDKDDLDDFLDEGKRAEVEERFRELEQQAEIDRLRAQSGGPSPAPDPAQAQPGSKGSGRTGSSDDPLSDLKAAVEGAEVERYLLVECPRCQARNRMALSKVRRATPVCGRCKQDLSFVKS